MLQRCNNFKDGNTQIGGNLPSSMNIPCHYAVIRLYILSVGSALLITSCSIKPDEIPLIERKPTHATEWATYFTLSFRDHPSRNGERLDDNIMIKAESRLLEQIVSTYLNNDNPEYALEIAKAIRNWRKVAALSEVALYLSIHGEAPLAKEILDLASEEAQAVTGWPRERIHAHLGRVNAVLAEVEGFEQMEAATMDKTELYKLDISLALYWAGKGDTQRAREIIDSSSQVTLAPLAIERTLVCLRIADLLGADHEAYVDFLEKAFETARSLEVQLRPEYYVKVMSRWKTTTEPLPEKFVSAVEELFVIEEGVEVNPRLLTPVLPVLAECCFLVDRRDDALRILTKTRDLVASNTRVTNPMRPEILSDIAKMYRRLGDEESFQQVLSESVAQSKTVINSRPRVESVVSICLDLAELNEPVPSRIALELEMIYDSLSDPW